MFRLSVEDEAGVGQAKDGGVFEEELGFEETLANIFDAADEDGEGLLTHKEVAMSYRSIIVVICHFHHFSHLPAAKEEK